MNPYVTLGMRDAAEGVRFYDAVLATVGWSSHLSFGEWRAYSEAGSGKGMTFWACSPFDGQGATVGNGTMVAFPARTKAQVDDFYQTAMALGGTDEGAPGPRDAYGPNWYAAYLRDPTGNKIAVYMNWAEQ